MDKMLLINIDFDKKPLSCRHIAWTAKETVENNVNVIKLIQIVEEFYQHPDAPKGFTLPKMFSRTRKTIRQTDKEWPLAKMFLLNVEAIENEFEDIAVEYQNPFLN